MNDALIRVPQKQRLDTLLVDLGLAESREKARALIMAGSVLVDDLPATKPGQTAPAGSQLRLRAELPYVSRGGLKLAAGLDAFALDPAGLTVADVGASTGGFTDCLLQRGAARVYAIDVGYGQLAWKLRQDSRVISLERTNVRTLQALPDAQQVDLAVIDVSFIGLDLVLPAVARLLREDGRAVVLIKPQFEAGRARVGKGGVVRDPAVHREVLTRVLSWAAAHGWTVAGLIRSPITGPKGNVEFLALLQRAVAETAPAVVELIDAVLASEPALPAS
ncbi:MAG TPA: TlyA family RNA methyltransferase [Anaerolineae bacterium]|nr:TlyA family RNA methyltransferase [Anaerolineae bacterium]HNU04492.1 TlyA family RNA methyltransferase [Anaerolineae bacterium]